MCTKVAPDSHWEHDLPRFNYIAAGSYTTEPPETALPRDIDSFIGIGSIRNLPKRIRFTTWNSKEVSNIRVYLYIKFWYAVSRSDCYLDQLGKFIALSTNNTAKRLEDACGNWWLNGKNQLSFSDISRFDTWDMRDRMQQARKPFIWMSESTGSESSLVMNTFPLRASYDIVNHVSINTMRQSIWFLLFLI